MLVSRDYWIVKGESGAAAAQNVDHAVPANQDVYLRYLYVASSDGSRVAYQLERPNGTVIFSGYTPDFYDFGMEGMFIPGAPDDDLRLAVSAGAATIVTRAWMAGIDKPRTH
jgi:hypothetical protein